MGKLLAAALLVLVLICLVLAALCLGEHLGEHLGGRLGGDGAFFGGAPRRRTADPAKSPHLVVDTLNLAHWLLSPEVMSPAVIVDTIDRTAPALKARHPGRLMYVLKDRESQFNTEEARETYRQAAARNGVYVYVAEKYADPPAGAKYTAEHSSRARDDFFMALLAHQWHCALLTEDRLRDFDEFRAKVPPFRVYEFAFWRELPSLDFVRPASVAYARLRRPRLMRYADYCELLGPIKSGPRGSR